MIERFHLLLRSSSDAFGRNRFKQLFWGQHNLSCGNIFFQVVPPLRPGIGTMSSP